MKRDAQVRHKTFVTLKKSLAIPKIALFYPFSCFETSFPNAKR